MNYDLFILCFQKLLMIVLQKVTVCRLVDEMLEKVWSILWSLTGMVSLTSFTQCVQVKSVW